MDMTTLAAPLQAALAAKGYESLTPVQEAVLAPELAGRDLLVSAQTGSGKTVAFGLAMAPEVMIGMDRLLPADKPLALIIAPTRELALQVQRELVWLYADATVASCVGGMDYRTERRALSHGAHIVVGTPGRLRDHVERGSLDLSELHAVVLDEADEMLDMGFSDDLEFLLGHAPEDKRVLMFSATVPKEIATLAATYQRDARRLEVKSSASQHADIEYKAISVSNRDKEPAIFNLLRWHDAKVAIVFAKTRANVTHLHARLTNRGFSVVALSGELSQSERLHALQALRDGRARVCIATDVAARGIDLPGLDLVIHADMPTNSETLLHRSGRTGRAGRKGTSVLVVPQADFRKANRILQGAKVVAEWAKAPGADALQAREDERLMGDASLSEAVGDEAGIAAGLLETHGADAVAAAFVRLWRSGRSAPEELSEDLPPPVALPPRERGEFGASVWYRLNVGHTGRAEARWLLPKICDAGGIAKDGIGAIRVQQDSTYVQIAAPLAERFKERLEIEADLVMERMAEAPEFGQAGRPARPERGPRPERFGGDRPERGAKPTYKPKARFDGEAGAGGEERKPWAKKAEGEERKPYVKREFDGEDRKPRGSYGDRPERSERPAYGERSERPAYGKSAGFRSHGGPSEGRPAKASGFKSHGKPEGGFAPREGGFKRREEGAGRDFGSRDSGPREGGYKSAGFKPRGEGGSEGRPFVKRDGPRSDAPRSDRPEGKSWGAKPAGAPKGAGAKFGGPKAGGDKPFGKKPFGAKPAAPRGDANDTSKRFTPPKKPRV